MAINALHKVNVVGALRGLECGIHLLDVEAAIGEPGMAVVTRGARLLSVVFVAGKATESFVNSDGRAVVPRSDLLGCQRSVALVAESLALVRADLHQPLPFVHLGQRQLIRGHVLEFTPVKQPHRRRVDFLIDGGDRLHRGPRQRQAMTVHLVAGQAEDGRAVGQVGLSKPPWACGIDGSHQVADAAVVVHPVAAEAVVHQLLFPVVLGVKENLLVGGAVQAGGPGGPLLFVARPAALVDAKIVAGSEPDLLRHFPAQVGDQAAHVVQVEPRIQREDVAVAGGALDITVRRGVPVRVRLPDLMAPGASFPVGILVIEAGRRQGENGQPQQAEKKVKAPRGAAVRWRRSR